MDNKPECVVLDLPIKSEVKGPILTVTQFEERHPGTRKRMRGFILRSDIGYPDYVGLRDAVIRVGRTVLLDEAAVIRWLEARKRQPRSEGRNPHGRAGKVTGVRRPRTVGQRAE